MQTHEFPAQQSENQVFAKKLCRQNSQKSVHSPTLAQIQIQALQEDYYLHTA